MTAAMTSFATARRDNYRQLKQEAQAAFNDSRAALDAARTDETALVAEAAALDKAIAALRRSLSGSDLEPAEIAGASDELEELLIARAHLGAAVAVTREDAHSAEVAADLYRQRLDLLEAELRAAGEALAQAEAAEARHSAWSDADLLAEIADLEDTAAALLADNFTPDPDPDAEVNPAALLAEARARVEGDIPEVLRERARTRAAAAADRLQQLEDLHLGTAASALEQGAAAGGSAGLVVRRRAEFELAEEALKRWALGSGDSYRRSLGLLAQVVASEPLAEASAERIAAAALEADDPALAAEAALHQARAAVEAKEIELEQAVIAARIADIDADPDDDGDVQARQAELELLEGELEAAEIANIEELSGALDNWEAAVPAFAWNNLQAFDTALALLQQLADTDGAALQSALTDGEAELIAALTEDDRQRRLSAELALATAQQARERDYLRKQAAANQLAALKGSY